MSPKAGYADHDQKASGCLICGEALIYLQHREFRARCVRCGKEEMTGVFCPNGHYVCDECHRRDILDLVEEMCLQSDLTDPIELAGQIFQLPGLQMHGPEYHGIVPAVLVTVHGNLARKKSEADIREAIARGKDIKGGFCGSHGACGAGLGVGIAYCLINRITPNSREGRGNANRLTSLALQEISRPGGPRCCKRDSILAIETAQRHLPGLEISRRTGYRCRQSRENRECIGQECPFFPAASGQEE